MEQQTKEEEMLTGQRVFLNKDKAEWPKYNTGQGTVVYYGRDAQGNIVVLVLLDSGKYIEVDYDKITARTHNTINELVIQNKC